MPVKITNETTQAKIEKIASFRCGVLSLAKAKIKPKMSELWFALYPGMVTLMNGESGAGKSSLLRLVALHAALDEPLFGIHFGLNRPLKVLYIDPENTGDTRSYDGGLAAERLALLRDERPANLFLHCGLTGDGANLDLSQPQDLLEMEEFIREEGIDLVILDPYGNLFNIQQENDNAEALQRIKAIKKIAMETSCAFLICHHTGKIGEEHSTNIKFGRGASALFGAVDVAMTFRLKSAPRSVESDEVGVDGVAYRSDFCRLKIEKNRAGFGHVSLYIQMAGEGRFNRISHREFMKAGDGETRENKRLNQMEEARKLIMKITSDNNQHKRQDLVDSAKAKGISEQNAMDVLSQLCDEQKLLVSRGGRGMLLYKRSASVVASWAGTPISAPHA